MKFAVIFFGLILIAGCSKHDDLGSNDSLLVASHTESTSPRRTEEEATGLVVDSFVTRQKPEMDTLKRLEPTQVVAIYDAYRPLRNHATTKSQLDSFLQSQKITEHELHAVLTEGDRLGWAGAKGH